MSVEIDFIRPELRPVRDMYEVRTRPRLERLDAEREEAVRRVKLVGTGTVAAAVATAVGVTALTSWGPLVPTAWVVMLGGILCAVILSRIKGKTKSALVNDACDAMDWRFEANPPQPPVFEDYLSYGLVPRHDRRSFEDGISGTFHDTDFAMTEVKLERRRKSKNGDSYQTVFRGCVMIVDFHQPFSSTTIVLRDRGWFNGKRKRDLKRVGMASPKWEKMFEAYGSDQVEARVKLDPAFMERLMELEESVDGKNLRFGFFDSQLHVVIETGNRFEPGSMFKPLADPRRIQRLIGEFAAMCAVIDGVRRTERA